MSVKLTNDLISGNPILDFQHRLALEMIKKLTTAFNKGQGADALKEAVTFFDCYVIEHFGDEEAIQQEHQYPEYSRHKEEHQQIISEFEGLKAKLGKEGYNHRVVVEAMTIFSRWMKKHFNQADRDLIQFLKNIYSKEAVPNEQLAKRS